MRWQPSPTAQIYVFLELHCFQCLGNDEGYGGCQGEGGLLDKHSVLGQPECAQRSLRAEPGLGLRAAGQHVSAAMWPNAETQAEDPGCRDDFP